MAVPSKKIPLAWICPASLLEQATRRSGGSRNAGCAVRTRRVAALVSGLAAAVAMLAPGPTEAQLQPHRAEYSLRLGTALNATRIGRAVQDIELDCDGWRIRRELSVDMSLTPSLKVSIAARVEGREQRGGNGFTWRTVQVVNGSEREVRGTVQRNAGTYRVEVETPGDAEQSTLPSQTLMPVAAMGYLVRRLLARSEVFPVLMFGAEAEGAAFLIEVKRTPTGTPDTTPPSQRHVQAPGTQSWSLSMAITRAGRPDGKPLLSLRGRVFDSGVFNALVVDAGAFTVAAHLQGLQMHGMPNCPR
ncbi:MAG: DUF1849 family protein [Reyranella sp.]|uniref:EipB family protein n=1 Tax=Reyranella sp. TaxID=1929291 RepID=UPI003D0EC77D